MTKNGWFRLLDRVRGITHALPRVLSAKKAKTRILRREQQYIDHLFNGVVYFVAQHGGEHLERLPYGILSEINCNFMTADRIVESLNAKFATQKLRLVSRHIVEDGRDLLMIASTSHESEVADNVDLIQVRYEELPRRAATRLRQI